jgi:SAM-dependent methyltransferase
VAAVLQADNPVPWKARPMDQQGCAKLVIPDRLRRGTAKQQQVASAAESGRELLELMRERLGLRDYSHASILDVGCGTRIPEAILANNIPVRKYVGMDVDEELIRYLREHVHDDRFEFYHLRLYNKRYNPSGVPLHLDYELPVRDKFDVVCLFSVFTHTDPKDTDCMLAVLSRHVSERGKLICTCILDATVSGFDDKIHDSPLTGAAYTEDLFRHLIVRNGWTIEALYPPTKSPLGYKLMQSCFVCSRERHDD